MIGDEIVKVYGEQAKAITEGVEYVAVVTHVEGRRVIELWRKDWCPECDGLNNKHYTGCLKVE